MGGYADRCGPGTRQPLLVVSPYSKVDAVDHTRTEQASITRFIEDNWHAGRIGDASFDTRAGNLTGAFDFKHPNDRQVLLNSDGSVKSVRHLHRSAAVEAAANSASAGTGGGSAATQDFAGSGSGSAALPLGITAGVLLVGGGGLYLALRHRHARTTS